MPVIKKRSSKLRFDFVASQKQSTLGGLPAVESLAQEFGLWDKIRVLPGIDPRVRTTHGYSPELIVAQFLYSFCSGGASLADAERLNEEPLARQLARVRQFADQTQLGEWLRKQSDVSITAFWQLISQFIQWVLQRAEAARWTYAGRAEVFFDDTQIEVFGPSFEGAKINYNGDLALSWQTLWVGRFWWGGSWARPPMSARRCLPCFTGARPFGRIGPVIFWPTAAPAAPSICRPWTAPVSRIGASAITNGPACPSGQRPRCRKRCGARPRPPAGAMGRKSPSSTPAFGTLRGKASLLFHWRWRAGKKRVRCSGVTLLSPMMRDAPRPRPSWPGIGSKEARSSCSRKSCAAWTCTTRLAKA